MSVTHAARSSCCRIPRRISEEFPSRLTAKPPLAEDFLAGQQASTRQTLIFDDNHMAAELYGESERTLRVLEQELGIDVRERSN